MNTAERRLQNCHAWIGTFIRLGTDGLPTSERLEQITSPEVRFIDPFNDLKGRPALRVLLEHTKQQLKDLHFDITDTAMSGNRVYVKWNMTARLKFFGEWRVEGVSEIEFDEEGRVSLHRDHWDSARQFYEKIPIIGWLLRRLRSSLSLS